MKLRSGNKPRAWTAVEREECERLFRDGCSVKDIASRLGRDLGVVYDFLTRSGIHQAVSRNDRINRKPITNFVNANWTLDNVVTGTPVPGRSALDGFVPPGRYGRSDRYSLCERRGPWDPRRQQNSE